LVHFQTESPLRVAVHDDDPLTARLLIADLERQDRKFDLRASAPVGGCPAEDLASASVVVLGLRPEALIPNGIELIRRLRREYPSVRIVVLVQTEDQKLVSELFRAGARGIFSRSEYDPEKLSRCIHCVAAGQVWAKSDQLCSILDAFEETAPKRTVSPWPDHLLTQREKDVVRLVADGFGNREVAQQLGLSAHTIKNYLFNVFDKLGVSSRAELIMYVLSSSDDRRNPKSEGSSRQAPFVLGRAASS
jgi:DNA-binding NarL/FixJ family response regulator